jgi:hypothetical protein
MADKIELPEPLSEFRTALEDEIEAAQQNESSSAVPLTNGRKVHQLGQAFQYFFEIENAINVPGDAPGDLYIKNRNPIPVTIISVDGLVITLSVAEDLGEFVPYAKIQSNLAQLMRKLIERIEGYQNKVNLVGDRVIGTSPISGSIADIPIIEGLNQYQTNAVRSSLGSNATFIWGPPGTGKTQTIGAIGSELYRRGRTLLVVSHTNTAVDQAILRIGERTPTAELEAGRVIRVGEPKDKRILDKPDLLLETHVARKAATLTARKVELEQAISEATLQEKKLIRLLGLMEWLEFAGNDIREMEKNLRELNAKEGFLSEKRNEFTKLSAQVQKYKEAEKLARSAKQASEEFSAVTNLLEIHKAEASQILSKLKTKASELETAERVLSESLSVSWLTRKWRNLPSPEEQKTIVERLRDEVSSLSKTFQEKSALISRYEFQKAGALGIIESFSSRYSISAEELLHKCLTFRDRIVALEAEIKSQNAECHVQRSRFATVVRERFLALHNWGLSNEAPSGAEACLAAIKAAYEKSRAEFPGIKTEQYRSDLDKTIRKIGQLQSEMKQIDETLKKIEEVVIAEASVIATTLTRAYLRESIQSRQFDTVILDEASMAPIPALWIAAGLSNNNVVVVGDPKQLPPIVMSPNELSQKWLGRDIFEVTGINDPQSQPSYAVILKKQYRMHPQISAIANELIYDKELEDGVWNINGQECDLSDDKCDSKTLAGWFEFKWGHDAPVLLIDTGSTNAWVTSVTRGNRTSRLNFLSATLSMFVVDRMLREDRPQLQPGDPPRILAISPYRPHARLTEMLIGDQGIADDVRAGTVHNFQGSEADVVILDLVNDEPHWKVGMFISNYDNMTRRLINVAVTRARRRLVVIGDFKYIRQQASKAFLGLKFIPYLIQNYRCIDAQSLLPVGLSARSAKAQSMLLGGEIEPDQNRIVVTQQHFYPLLRGDISRSKHRVIIYSPFLTTDRFSYIEHQIRSAIERGIRIYVITKALSDRNKREVSNYRMLEQSLREWGVVVIHKGRMHEKLVFVDDVIIWVGSLNTLSYSDTREIMERRVSKTVVEDYAKTLRLNELVSDFDEGNTSCPICGSEMIACEGKKDPYYWRCVQDDCYTRSIGQPPIKEGVIKCANCGGNVEFGEWGGEPNWRCILNRRHRQPIAKTHLRLPNMVKLIPSKERKKLIKMFGIEELDPINESKMTQVRVLHNFKHILPADDLSFLLKKANKGRYNLKINEFAGGEELIEIYEKGVIDIFILVLNNIWFSNPNSGVTSLERSVKLVSQIKSKYERPVAVIACCGYEVDSFLIERSKQTADFYFSLPFSMDAFIQAFEKCLRMIQRR